jgi:hypothetical protein
VSTDVPVGRLGMKNIVLITTIAITLGICIFLANEINRKAS